MTPQMNRRLFVKNTLIASATAGLALEGVGCKAPAQPKETPKETPKATAQPTPAAVLPCGQIGKLKVSRMLLGGNLLTHYTHSRDLKYVYNLAAHYNTDEKILETLAVAEANGINTLSMHNPPHPISLLRRYRKERGGKIQWIICPTAPVTPDMGEYRKHVESLLQDGCEAIYLWGVHGDSLVSQEKYDLIAKAVALPKEYGVPSGVGGHGLAVVQACEKYGVGADFYIKTFHHHSYQSGPKTPEDLKAPYNEFPGYWCREPKETAEFMQTVNKPWIAFKIMAAGAIPPASAFRYAFKNGADFCLSGMFDYEIAEDVKICADALASAQERPRPWHG